MSSKPGKKDATGTNDDLPPSAGYLISCDIPTKQFIQYLNELKPVDKKFIIQDLDATHLLVKHKAKDEITRKVEEWLDENVFSAVEKMGEDLATV
jgi:TFIIH basal transcription factor complex TTD-A subunit